MRKLLQGQTSTQNVNAKDSASNQVSNANQWTASNNQTATSAINTLSTAPIFSGIFAANPSNQVQNVNLKQAASNNEALQNIGAADSTQKAATQSGTSQIQVWVVLSCDALH